MWLGFGSGFTCPSPAIGLNLVVRVRVIFRIGVRVRVRLKLGLGYARWLIVVTRKGSSFSTLWGVTSYDFTLFFL